MRTAPVNHSGEPWAEGSTPLRLISIARLPDQRHPPRIPWRAPRSLFDFPPPCKLRPPSGGRGRGSRMPTAGARASATAGDNDPLPALPIAAGLDVAPPPEQRAHAIARAIADLQNQPAAGPQRQRRLRHQFLVGLETGRTGDEGRARLVVAHRARQRAAFRRATASAAAERSSAATRAAGRSNASVTAIAPEPAPASAARAI